jgi:hypothetical protein
MSKDEKPTQLSGVKRSQKGIPAMYMGGRNPTPAGPRLARVLSSATGFRPPPAFCMRAAETATRDGVCWRVESEDASTLSRHLSNSRRRADRLGLWFSSAHRPHHRRANLPASSCPAISSLELREVQDVTPHGPCHHSPTSGGFRCTQPVHNRPAHRSQDKRGYSIPC